MGLFRSLPITQPWLMRVPKPCVLPVRPTTRRALLASGMSAQMIRTALSAGRLVRVRSGVFLDAALWPEDAREQHLLRAEAEVEQFPAAVLSHESAGSSWNLPAPGFTDWHEHLPSVTVPSAKKARSRVGLAIHRVGSLPEEQLTRDGGGRPVTSLARTAVDLAAGRSLPEALVMLDAAARQLCQGMVAQPRRRDYANPRLIAATRELLDQASTTRRPAGLAAMIALADPRRESPAESLSAGHFHLAGIPTPLFQEPIESPEGNLHPDCYWPDANLVGECDGAVKYADHEGYVREKEREQLLRDMGYRIKRWQAKEIMLTPNVVVARIARALG